MKTTAEAAPTCRVVRSVESYQGKQGPLYAGAVSAETVGAQAVWLGMITHATLDPDEGALP